MRSYRFAAVLSLLAAPARAVTVRVMTYNVHSCRGWDRRVKPERIAEVIAAYHPDVVALQEVRVGKVDQPRAIAEKLGMSHRFFPLVRLPSADYGIAVLSRLPLRLVREGPLPAQKDKPHERRGVLWVAVDAGGRELQVVDTHLSLSAAERQAQAGALTGPEWLGAPGFPRPFVVCADLNSAPGDGPARALAGLAEDALGAAAAATFPSLLPLRRIDHVFASAGVAAAPVATAPPWLARLASDHLPAVVDLTLP